MRVAFAISWLSLLGLALAYLRLDGARNDAEERRRAAETDRSRCADDLRVAHARLKDLEERLHAAEEAVLEANDPGPLAASALEPAERAPGGAELDSESVPGRELPGSAEEARLEVEALLARGDLQSAWQLVLDLVSSGEGGHAVLLDLATGFSTFERQLAVLRDFWGDGIEMHVRMILPGAVRHAEGFLRFGLYLDRYETGELPEVLRPLREAYDESWGTMLLGFYRGDDRELLDAYVARYRARLAGDHVAGRHAEHMIRSLGEIPTEQAEDLLLDLLPRVPSGLHGHVVRALVRHGSDRSLRALRLCLERTTDPNLRGTLETAVRFLEGS